MKLTAKFAGALLGAMTFSGAALASIAGPTTPPGERAGLDLASPLPEGVYFVNIASVGSWRSVKAGSNGFDYNVPIVAWSTPWTIAGGRIQLLGAMPEVTANSPTGGLGGFSIRGLYNPFVAGQIAWNIGNGFSVSYLAGAYIGITGTDLFSGGYKLAANPFNQTTFHQMLSLAWHGDGWNATANLIYNLVGNSSSVNAGAPVLPVPTHNASFFNYDLGLTKTIGKWEVGIIAYGSVANTGTYNDPNYGINTPIACSGCSQFALGGLVGYNFGPVITQATVATDLYVHDNTAGTVPGYGWPQKETRGVLRTIIPLWNPEAPKAVVAKY
ncbi:hypothetical protein M2323_002391 [Rhodoblastus acidophilus]|uniref:transporter n=1 Tax=Rhodoblastus acidophilus TaxID=1074 RepID=UPI0022243CCF|nr:transporter [Rhodoblastus acidophilus]MCW2286371.1 hypothetical protein [Rhodoblastus acidophilus]MCW2333457.1 hypothetical protein [Rhodoblastus acidophilus]